MPANAAPQNAPAQNALAANPMTVLRGRCRGLSAGIFAADPGALSAAAGRLAGWGGAIVHFDVMDGVFVPQITAGPAFVAALGTGLGAGLGAGLLRDVHLMVQEPARHVAGFVKAGADIIAVHAEATGAAQALAAIRTAAAAQGRPVLAGLAVMPGTALDSLAPLLALRPDLILVLALDPRDGKAADLPAASARLRDLRRRCAELAPDHAPVFAFDGGVTEASVAEAASTAPEIIVSGSAIFGAAEPGRAFARLTSVWAEAQANFAEHHNA